MLATLAAADLKSLRSGLQRVRADPLLSPESREELALVDRLVWLLDRTWTRSAPHLAVDNQRLQVLLEELAGLVPGCDLSSVVTPNEENADEVMSAPFDHEGMTARNQLLRAMLSQVITETWNGQGELARVVAARAGIALREGLASRPW